MKSNDYLIPRISQLTLKTNQFNLTTKRYTESDILKYTKKKNYYVYCLEVKDKIGDYGITGVAIIKYLNNEAHFDSFLMSCRVIGRNVEYVFFEKIIEELKNKNLAIAKLFYIKSMKNEQVSSLFNEFNCNILKKSDTSTEYSLNLNEFNKKGKNLYSLYIVLDFP